jgi:hypothetical protein
MQLSNGFTGGGTFPGSQMVPRVDFSSPRTFCKNIDTNTDKGVREAVTVSRLF